MSIRLPEMLPGRAVPQTSGQGLVSDFQMRVAVGHRGKKLLRLYGAVMTGWPLQAIETTEKCDFLRAHQ